MKAVRWYGRQDLRVENVLDPTIINDEDAIIKMTSASICGSDIHIYDGYIPTMEKGDIIGHEFMGIVQEVGSRVESLNKGDRVVVSSAIGCGICDFCKQGLWSLCDNSNRNGADEAKLFGYPTSAFYGYSHAFGGVAGAFAEYIRVPYADKGAFKVPDDIGDEKLLFCSDAFPTGYMAAEYCQVKPGDTVAVWGCGAVGQFAMKSLRAMGIEKIIAIDRFDYRLKVAKSQSGAIPLNYTEKNILHEIQQLTAGKGPDACLDAVGLEAQGTGIAEVYDKAKQTVGLETGRPHVLRDAILACRKGGTVSIIGVYAGLVDKIPMGAAFNKSLTFRMGQMNGQKYIPMLLDKVRKGEVDPSFVVTHRVPLSEVPAAFKMFRDKTNEVMRVVIRNN